MTISENNRDDIILTPKDLYEFLHLTAISRPVFIWGPPGVGKSSIVNQFANSLDLECVSLIGSQLRAEDVMGIPQMIDGTYRFAPPAMIARHEKYCLFLDEFNASRAEVQKAFHTLIHEKRVGEYVMPKGSVVIAAGNRAQDGAKVNPLSSIIINRMLHVNLSASTIDWLNWAKASHLHPVIIEYIMQHEDHLFSSFDENKLAFSTPRSWHILSDSFASISTKTPPRFIKSLCYGSLSEEHATCFLEFAKDKLQNYTIRNILDNKENWPMRPSEEHYLNFLISSLKHLLYLQLPKEEMMLTPQTEKLVNQSKVVLDDLKEKKPQLVDYILSAPLEATHSWNRGDSNNKAREIEGQLPQWFRNKFLIRKLY